MKPFRFFERREDRAIVLRQQAEDVFARIRNSLPSSSMTGTPLRGQHNQRRGGMGHEFWQYRDFQGGDLSRSIDWKQSAKSDRILIRQKEQETQKRTSLWLQNDPGMAFKGAAPFSKYETGCILTLVTAMLCEERHDPFILSGAGRLSLDTLTHVLDEARTQPLLNELRGEDIFLIGDFLEEDFDRAIFDLVPGNRMVHVIQILDPQEIDLPFSGRTVFEHPGAHEREQILNVASIRDAYAERLAAHLQTVRDSCAARHWSYTFIRSGQDLAVPYLDIILHGEAR